MRKTTPFLIAAALTASSAAIAQDTNNVAADTAVSSDTAVVDDNAMMSSDVVAVPANDLGMAPEAVPADTLDTGAPVDDDDDGGFPWGVLGLVGLLGLIPRKKND